MGMQRFGNISLDPAANPAVLDTATWHMDAAAKAVFSAPAGFWETVMDTGLGDVTGPAPGEEPGTGFAVVESPCGIRAYPGSIAVTEREAGEPGAAAFILCRLPGGMHVLVRLARGGNPRHATPGLGAPAAAQSIDGVAVAVYPCDSATMYAYTGSVDRERAPRALGSVPRLGIGDRHSVMMWPGIFRAMSGRASGRPFSANAIQNSLRELNLLDDFLAGGKPKENYLFGYGSIQEGHTGSSFEGLWLYGVLSALKSGNTVPYGADADHIQVKRGPAGLERARQVVTAAAHYSFFTLDVSDILNYAALDAENAGAASASHAPVDDSTMRALMAFHRRRRNIGGFIYEPGEERIERMAAKYHSALDAVQDLAGLLHSLKKDRAFDLELSVDEHPPEIDSYGSVTAPDELSFLLLEALRRGIPLTHAAPNFGVEKGVDYRCPDGIEGLSRRVTSLTSIAAAFGVMLDCHSGDDLSGRTRRAIGEASAGRIHFKVSPSLQNLFAETVYDFHRPLFDEWWQATLEYARREARNGGTAAAEAVAEYQQAEDGSPHPSHAFFRHLNFAPVGERDGQGNFLFRDKLYRISNECLAEYTARLAAFLERIAGDIFGSSGA